MNKMNRVTMQAVLLVLILTLIPGALFSAPEHVPVEDAPGKPNFLWIVSEDNSTHYMQLFDSNGIATPAIESMAEAGILFTRAFSNAPVCSVARSTLISGCYAPRTGTQYHRRSELVPMPEGVRMFPAYLREAGYYTTNNHKEDYNYVKSEGTWDESSPAAHWTNRSPGQPFFHMESHAQTHESSLHFGSGFSDTYMPVTDPASVFLFPQHPDTELFRFTAAYYRDRILAVDSIVGSVLRQLEESGELENTFVFYFGDHGGVLPGSKGYLWESGLHVPLVVRIPENFSHLAGSVAGSASGRFVSFVDFGPTLLALAGIALPEGIDGVPFMNRGTAVIAGDAVHQEIDSFQAGSRMESDEGNPGTVFGYADRFDEKYDMVRTVRHGQFKYMRSYQPFNFDGLQNNYRYRCLAYRQWRELYAEGRLDPVQRAFFEPREPEALYDLAVDPYETRNLAEDPAYRTILLEMRKRLNEWVRGMPDLGFFPEPYLRREVFGNPVRFGRLNRERIAGLAEIADLELAPFDAAREGIGSALRSGDPLRRYWGLIVCSAFGKEAAPFVSEAKRLCSDPDLLVRTRAAEFLGIAGRMDPVPVLKAALYETTDPWEALLILNSAVLLRDGYGYAFTAETGEMEAGVLQEAEVQRRLEYLKELSGTMKKL